jgi:hypothetical protein
MSAGSPAPRPVPSASSRGHAVRVEYLDFQDVDEHREYRFTVYGPYGSSEPRMRIANAAFEARRVLRQDGPDLCYQKLLREIAAGVTEHAEVSTIDDVELLKYRDDHTVAARHRPYTGPSPATGAAGPRVPPPHRPSMPRTVSPKTAAVPAVTNAIEPVLEEGQRVRHAIFGLGVTTATTSDRTVVSFDRDGPRSFVTSMLEVEVLSAPHTWNTSRRGVNRPCGDLASGTDSPI